MLRLHDMVKDIKYKCALRIHMSLLKGTLPNVIFFSSVSHFSLNQHWPKNSTFSKIEHCAIKAIDVQK